MANGDYYIYKEDAEGNTQPVLVTHQILADFAKVALGTAAQKDFGGNSGQLPVVPVAMSSMSTPVKATIDAITATSPDPAAFQHASAFATAAQGVKADTALQNAAAFDAAGAAAAALVTAKAYTDSGISALVGGASSTLDTLNEIATRLVANETLDATLINTVAGKFPIPSGNSGQYLNGAGTPVAFPTIPAAQVNADWNAASGISQILNKPLLGTAALLPTETWQPAPKVLVRERRMVMFKTGVNMNLLGGDVAVWSGLPAQYRVVELFSCRASSVLTGTAKIGLFTGAGATGTAIVTSSNVGLALNQWINYTIVSAVAKNVFTSPTLYLNNTIALGLAATACWGLVIEDLTD